VCVPLNIDELKVKPTTPVRKLEQVLAEEFAFTAMELGVAVFFDGQYCFFPSLFQEESSLALLYAFFCLLASQLFFC